MKLKNEVIAKIINKFSKCQLCTEEELDLLTSYYSNLIDLISPLGKEFGLFKKEIRIRYEEQLSCQEFRKK